MAPSALDRHVARRLTHGPTPQVLAEIAAMGTTAWIDHQLDWRSIDDAPMDAILGAFPRSMQTAAEITAAGPAHPTRGEMAAATVARAIWSRRQLHELLVDFWWNHFNIDIAHEASTRHVPTHDRDVIRHHATGRFADLLTATAKSPAMLLYLDQATSRVDGGRLPIENYARELLELHTVGVDGGYDETDVKEVAWLLSGWTVASRSEGGFTFRAQWHADGPLAKGGDVLGWTPGRLTGLAAGESLLVHLARHPATARRLAHKLAVRFIGEHIGPDDVVVVAAASAYTAADTAIEPMLRSLLRSDEFAASSGRRVRRPLEYLAALARATGRDWDPTQATAFRRMVEERLSLLGQVPLAWPTPDGYPDADDHWTTAGAMVARWNLAALAANGFDARPRRIDTARVLDRMIGAPAPTTVGEALDRVAVAATGGPLDDRARSATLAALDATARDPWSNDRDGRTLVSLVLQSPANQVR